MRDEADPQTGLVGAGMDFTNAHKASGSRLSDDAISRVVALHGANTLRVARRHSLTSADAEDAYQNTLETLLTKPPNDDLARLGAWLAVVARNEALMIQRKRKKLDRTSFEEMARDWRADTSDLDDRVIDGNELRLRREALSHLTSDQLRCLLLKADGMSYDEISDATGLSYASVNRYLTEGRKAYRRMLGRIENGERCRSLEPKISMLADGTLEPDQLDQLRAHLDHCAGCRATLMDFRAAPQKVAALLPVGVGGATANAGPISNALEQVQSLLGQLQDRIAGYTPTFHSVTESSVATKIGAVTATAAALAAGGYGMQHTATDLSDQLDSPEYVAVPIAAPSQETGPTGGAPGEQAADKPSAADRPVTPTVTELVDSSTAASPSADESSQSDATANSDPYAAQPQFEAPTEFDTDTSESDTYDGFAP